MLSDYRAFVWLKEGHCIYTFFMKNKLKVHGGQEQVSGRMNCVIEWFILEVLEKMRAGVHL